MSYYKILPQSFVFLFLSRRCIIDWAHTFFVNESTEFFKITHFHYTG